MQVKKFEARTMKEALEMIKLQLGPDAIILGVKDNRKNFGLVGEKSIEVTAAVSEGTLHKKKFAESRIRESDKQKLALSSAKVQKEFISKLVSNYQTRETEDENPRIQPAIRARYIDIEDDADQEKHVPQSKAQTTQARSAYKPQSQPAPVAAPAAPTSGGAREANLVAEIDRLKGMLQQFKNIPQTITETKPNASYPGADYGLSFDCSNLFEKLIAAGVHTEIVTEILLSAQGHIPPHRIKNKSLLEAWVAKRLLDQIQIVKPEANEKIQFFLGPPGCGKTSSLLKIASRLVVEQKKRIGILIADSNKVGAIEQMKIYSQILNVPFGIIKDKNDWINLKPQLENFDHVLVDGPGLSLKSYEDNSTLRMINPPSEMNARTHLVLNNANKDMDLAETCRRYESNGFTDLIFSNLDHSSQHGSLFNCARRTKAPLHSFGIGPRVPEDLEFATKERVLDLLLKLSDTQSAQQPTQQPNRENGDVSA